VRCSSATALFHDGDHISYVDQPTGTGFSYGLGMDHDEAQVHSSTVLQPANVLAST
jgi:hypothetical protein